MRALLGNDIRLLLSRRRLPGFVLLLLCFFGIVYAGTHTAMEEIGAEKVNVGIVNYDTSAYSQMLISYYRENGLFSSYVSVCVDEEERIVKSFEEGELDLYLVIPEDFADAMVYLEHKPVRAVISTGNSTVEILMKNLLESYENYISAVEVNCVSLHDIMLAEGAGSSEAARVNDRISLELILLALDKDAMFEHKTVEDYTAIELLPYYINELLFLFMAYFALMAGVQMQKEHHAGILRRMIALGTPVMGIFIEKLLFCSFQLTLLLSGMWWILKLFGIGVSIELLIFCSLFGLLLIAGMLLLSSVFQSMKNYLLASNMSLMLCVMLGGGLIPYMYLPDGMLALAGFSPNYWFLRLMISMENGAYSVPAAGLYLLPFAVSILFAAAAAVCYCRKEGRVYENA